MADQILPSPDRVVTGYLRSPEGRLIPIIVEQLPVCLDEWSVPDPRSRALLTAAGRE